MALARQKPSGKWEVGLRHPSLPGGRKYFTFDAEVKVRACAHQWTLMKLAGIEPPAELLQPKAQMKTTLARVGVPGRTADMPCLLSNQPLDRW